MVRSFGEVRFTRPVPPQWGELVNTSYDLLIADDPVARTPAMTQTLLDNLHALDNEALEAHRYYGIGLIMCGMARILADPNVRVRTQQFVGGNLFETWRTTGSTERDSLQPRDIQAVGRTAFIDIALQADDTLPPEIRLLNDGMHLSATLRRSPESPVIRPDRGILHTDGTIERGAAAKFVGNQTLSAASYVLSNILQKYADYTPDPALDKADPSASVPPTIVEIMDATDDESLGITRVGMRCAALRLDEFRDINRYVELSSGKIVFRKDRMTPVKELAPPEHPTDLGVAPVLHTGRLRCPAMFVELPAATGSSETALFIPFVLDTFSAALRHADMLARMRSESLSLFR